MTRLRDVAVLRILAVSTISTMNVLWPRQFIAGTDASKDSIGDPDFADSAGTKRTGLGQQRDQRHLANVRALARHVGTGDQQDHARFGRMVQSLGTNSPCGNVTSSTGWRPGFDASIPNRPSTSGEPNPASRRDIGQRCQRVQFRDRHGDFAARCRGADGCAPAVLETTVVHTTTLSRPPIEPSLRTLSIPA
jgi:hypothetical protein